MTRWRNLSAHTMYFQKKRRKMKTRATCRKIGGSYFFVGALYFSTGALYLKISLRYFTIFPRNLPYIFEVFSQIPNTFSNRFFLYTENEPNKKMQILTIFSPLNSFCDLLCHSRRLIFVRFFYILSFSSSQAPTQKQLLVRRSFVC